MTFDVFSLDLLWRNALAAIPLALAVACICRWLPCRASTRHALWVIALLSLLAPPFAPKFEIVALSPAPSLPKESAPQIPRVALAATPTAKTNQPFRVPSSKDQKTVSTLDRFPLQAAAPPVAATTSLIASHLPKWLETSSSAASGECPDLAFLDECPPMAESVRPVEPSAANLADHRLLSDFHSLFAGDRSSPSTNVPALNWAQGSFVSPWSIASSRAWPLTNIGDSSAFSKSAELPSSFSPMNTWAANWSSKWSQWIGGVFAVRDAIVQMTPIPATLWFGGCILIVAVLSIRTLRFRRILRNCHPAPRDIEQLVAHAAREIGLSLPPQTFISQARISPMIWCGWRRILLLPESLWNELDDLGRRTVLLHELAHLRRRDHWIRWIELIVGCVYWWHPVVWFIRKKLRDEADVCCDMWVTSLLPTARTSYARALVTTRQYISESQHPMPAVGLGVTNNRTKLFARRLTMVMTERSGPRLSAFGVGLTLCLALAAWLAAPLWACPPESSEAKTKQGQEMAAVEAQRAIEMRYASEAKRAAEVDHARRARTTAPQAPDASTFERHMAERELQAARTPQAQQPMRHQPLMMTEPGSDPRLNNRLDRLEERLNRLTEQLERMANGPSGDMAPPRSPQRRQRADGPSVPAPPSPPSPPAHPAPPAPPAPPSASSFYIVPGTPTDAIQGYYAPHAQAEMAYRAALGSVDDGEIITRVYKLPEGKAEALYELMRRDDVPIYVSADGEGIAVQATPRQHEAFGSFIVLIHPEAKGQQLLGSGVTFTGSPGLGTLRALTEVPGTQGRIHAIKMAKPQIEALRQTIQSRQGEMQNQIKLFHKRAEEINRKARDLEKQSSKLQSKAEAMEDGPAKDDLLAQAEALENEAEALNDQAEAQADQAESVQDMIESLRDQLTDAMEAIEEQAIEASELQADVLADAMEAAEIAIAEAAEAVEVAETPEPQADDDDADGDKK